MSSIKSVASAADYPIQIDDIREFLIKLNPPKHIMFATLETRKKWFDNFFMSNGVAPDSYTMKEYICCVLCPIISS